MKLKELSEMFKALGHETRIQILEHLRTPSQPVSPGAISSSIKVDYEVVHYHCEKLRDAGLIVREGKSHPLYALDTKPLRVMEEWLSKRGYKNAQTK